MKRKSLSIRIYFILYICFMYHLPALTQDHMRKNWYFGNSEEGIHFNRSSRAATRVTDQATPFGTGGCSVATDPITGNLLFYTDGNVVYDRYHNPMPSGRALNANNVANQPTAVSAVPNQRNKYYIFTNTANYDAGGAISYSIVDMTLSGAAVDPNPVLGDIESDNTAIANLTNRSEGMITVPHSNGTDFWLITHEINSQNYSATEINAAAYTGGVFNTISSTGIGTPLIIAGLAYHPQLKKIAVSPQSPNDNALILNFDDTTGDISFDRFIENTAVPGAVGQAVYDIEWSPNGRYVYLSKYGGVGVNADLIQYDYSDTTVPLTSVLPTPVHRSYGIQIAPDTSVYHIYQTVAGGPFLLGRLTRTENQAGTTVYLPSPFGTYDLSGMQFPSFLPKQTISLDVTFTSIGTCQNTPTAFFATVTPGADSLVWDFGDGNQGKGMSPIHTYSDAQTYTVSLTAFYGDQTQTTTNTATINAFPLSVQLVSDTTACRSEFPPSRGTSTPQQFQITAKITGGTPASIVWSNGDTGETLTPDSAGYYYVVVTDASGCAAYAGVNLKEYLLEEQRANIWYFGEQAGIDFNPLPDPPIALDNSVMNAPEGTSAMSDRNGDIIFYTNGNNVYDKTHTEVTNNIGGNTASAQSALIVPVPDDETLYYIFTTQATERGSNYELRYSLFDLKQNNGLGTVIEQNILLYSKSTERITSNGQWLISHEYGNNTFRSYPITKDGIGNPVFSGIGSPHSFKSYQTGQGYINMSSDNELAVALSNPGVSNHVELFSFDNLNGSITNFREIDLNEPNGQVYGIAFSSGGNKIFATLKGSPTPSAVYEYYLDTLGTPILRNVTPQPQHELGALQIGPDGQIYMAVNGSSTLGTIQASEDVTTASAVNIAGFNLAAGTRSGLGLPNFIQIISTSVTEPSIMAAGFCLGQPTSFTGTPTDEVIDEFQWFFGDGGSDTARNPTHTYTDAGTYNVSLYLTNRCGLDTTLTQSITLSPTPPKPTIPAAIALCNDPITLNANTNNIPGYTYVWSTGETTQTITVSEASIVSVTNTDMNECSSEAETFVGDNRPQLDLGPDATLCTANTPSRLDALNPGATYSWTINGTNTGNTNQVQELDLSVPGTFTYEVTITDPETNCLLIESKQFTINVTPSFDMFLINPTNCGAADGSAELRLYATTPVSGPYSYTVTGSKNINRQGMDINAPTTIGPVTNLSSGTVSATVTDQSSGCALSKALALNEPALFGADFTATDCDPTEITVTITGGTPTLPILYTYTHGSTGESIGPVTTNVAQLSAGAGNYAVTAHDDNGNGCLVSMNKTIAFTSKQIDITENICSDPPTLTAFLAGATGYTWTGGGIVSGGNTNTVTINSGGTYEVTATIVGCDVKASREVNLVNITPEFTQSDPCNTSITVTASPAGSYTYRWFKEGVFEPTLLGPKITLGLSENGSNYSVATVNTINGCIRRGPDKRVDILGPIDASLTSSQACNDNNPFTLTASTTATGVTYEWFRDGNSIASTSTATLNQNNEGLYKVIISKSSCSANAEIQITKAPSPMGQLPNRGVICNADSNQDPETSQVVLDPGLFTEYEWFKDGISLGNTNRTFTAKERGIYKVILTNTYGCTAPDETEISIECKPVVESPTAFRPNSKEGANQTFSIFSSYITEDFEIFIYTRWGELIYQSKDRSFKWNGNYNNTGTALPGGHYAYLIRYISSYNPELGIQEKRGGVVLIR